VAAAALLLIGGFAVTVLRQESHLPAAEVRRDASAACDAFAAATILEGAQLEALLANGAQAWPSATVTQEQHAVVLTGAVAALRAEFGALGVDAGDGLAAAGMALADLEQIAAEAADAGTDADADAELYKAMRAPYVEATVALARIGVAGC
jgi:hypothetical protein